MGRRFFTLLLLMLAVPMSAYADSPFPTSRDRAPSYSGIFRSQGTVLRITLGINPANRITTAWIDHPLHKPGVSSLAMAPSTANFGPYGPGASTVFYNGSVLPEAKIVNGKFRFAVRLIKSHAWGVYRFIPLITGSMVITGALNRTHDVFTGTIATYFEGRLGRFRPYSLARYNASVRYSARVQPGATWKAH